MGTGIAKWPSNPEKDDSWLIEVELSQGEYAELTKVEYIDEGHKPPFSRVPRVNKDSVPSLISVGMKRICRDFTKVVEPHGFKKTKSRCWVRLGEHIAETIYFHRRGSSYGTSLRASVSLRVMLSVHILNAPAARGGIGFFDDYLRRHTGYGYHHRFNAKSWSTYDRCLDELKLYMQEVAEPWFKKHSKPKTLLSHNDINSAAKALLRDSLSGNKNMKSIEEMYKRLGVKSRK